MSTFATSYAVKREIDKEAKGNAKINLPNILLYIVIVIFLVTVFIKAFSQASPFLWLFGMNGAPGGPIPEDIAKALGPILALSLAIERLLETVFDVLETNFAKIAELGMAGAEGLGYIQEINSLYMQEMDTAKDALRDALSLPLAEQPPAQEKTKLIDAVQLAEKRFRASSSMWETLNKDPKYISWKRALSIWLGLALGMVVAVFSEKGMFYYLHLEVPRLMDMLLTGFIIGAGSGPLHSLIGILQGAKDSLSKVGNLAGLQPVQDEVDELRKQIAAQNK